MGVDAIAGEHPDTADDLADEVVDEPRSEVDVEIGDRRYTVGRFRGFKATQILKEAAAIGRRYPKLGKDLAKFKAEFEAENRHELSRTEAEYQLGEAARQISDKAWESSGGKITLRRSPTVEEQVTAIFPDLLEHAEKHVLRLLALIAAPNAALCDAWDEDRVDDYLQELTKTLLREGDAEELVDLALAGVEVGRGQFGPLRDRVGKLLAQIGLVSNPTPKVEMPDPEATETEPEETTTTDEAGPTSPPSSETSPSSSTDSPAPTDGHPEKSSTARPGSLSAPSPTG